MSTTIPAGATAAPSIASPSTRFAALRGLPLPWVAVAGMAVLLALADAFILVALRGAVGAIERTQNPFSDWLRYSAILAPVFAVAVAWALRRAHRKHDLTSAAMRSFRRTTTTIVLIAAAVTAVAVTALIASAAYDYHLQSNLLAATQTLHNHAAGPGGADPAYGDGAWTPEQRETMLVSVKGVGLGSVFMIVANTVLVGWVAALRGGRVGARSRRS